MTDRTDRTDRTDTANPAVSSRSAGRQVAIACSVIRGGTSKGLFFDARDLPADRPLRDAVLLAAMGSPDPREIDGMGGGHPLTSKVAVVSRSARPDADVDYLFLQVWPERPEVSDTQNCGNILAGVGPFAIERGMVAADDGVTQVRIWMQNTGSLAVADVQTPDRCVSYAGTTRIDGVPGTHAPVSVEFVDIAGSSCGALLPTGNVVDRVHGVDVTCVDNGMPVVCVDAAALGASGRESPAELEADDRLTRAVEEIRLGAGRLMGLGDVAHLTVPKVSLLSPGTDGGLVNTRTFIPRRVHESIGVLGAVSVATACLLPGSVAAAVAGGAVDGGAVDGGGPAPVQVRIEHPTGSFGVELDLTVDGDTVEVRRAALTRTARLLMRGEVLVPSSVWSQS